MRSAKWMSERRPLLRKHHNFIIFDLWVCYQLVVQEALALCPESSTCLKILGRFYVYHWKCLVCISCYKKKQQYLLSIDNENWPHPESSQHFLDSPSKKKYHFPRKFPGHEYEHIFWLFVAAIWKLIIFSFTDVWSPHCVLFLILDAHSKDWLAPPPSCRWCQGSWQDTAATRCTPWRSPWPPPWAAPWSSSAAPSPCMCTSSLRIWFWMFLKSPPTIFFFYRMVFLLIKNITSDLSTRCLRGKTANGHWRASMSHGTLLSLRW